MKTKLESEASRRMNKAFKNLDRLQDEFARILKEADDGGRPFVGEFGFPQSADTQGPTDQQTTHGAGDSKGREFYEPTH